MAESASQPADSADRSAADGAHESEDGDSGAGSKRDAAAREGVEEAGSSDTAPPSFTLRNAGAGPDPLSLERIAAEVDFAVLLLLRDYHCPKCRAQVQRVAEKADTLERGDAAVVAILPDTVERARSWQASYDLPFPLLADPGGEVNDEYDQPRRFGVFGKLHDVIGRMPKAVVLDLRDGAEVAYSYEGSSPRDRPEIEELFETVDDLKAGFVFDCDLVDC